MEQHAHAEAVELDFVNPAIAGWRTIDEERFLWIVVGRFHNLSYREACAALRPAGYQGTHAVQEVDEAGAAMGAALVDVPMYQTDALLRRAPSLQRTREGRTPAVTY